MSFGSANVSAPYCPNTSKLTQPNTAVRGAQRVNETVVAAEHRRPGEQAASDERVGRRDARLAPDPGEIARQPARAHRLVRQRDRPCDPGVLPHRDQTQGHPGAGLGRALGRRLVAGHRTAEEEGVRRRLGQRPGPDRTADRAHPPGVVGPVDRLERRVHGVAELVVAVHDQQGQQLVAAGDVAVDRGRDQPEVAGDGAQRQGRGAVRGQVLAADADDVTHGLLAGPGAGRGSVRHRHSVAHQRAAVTKESSALALGSQMRHPDQTESTALSIAAL